MPVSKGYSLGQIRLHWIVVVLLVPQYLLHDTIKHDFFTRLHGGIAAQSALQLFHIFGGMILFLLMLWRLERRSRLGVPPAADGETTVQALVAKAVHVLLYAVILLMPITGLWAWFGLSRTGAELHEAMKLALLLLVFVHVVGAIYNHFVLKNGLIDRMREPG